MFRILSKINCVCVCLVLSPVVSQCVNTSNGVRIPNQHEEIIFRVTNGIPAKLGTVPYQVSIKARIRDGSYISFCGGALIARNKILSAGHCFAQNGNVCQRLCRKVPLRKFKGFYVVAGILKTMAKYKEDGVSSEQWRTLKSVHVPPGYKFPDKDIAVAFTSKSFVFDKYVNSLPYATKNMDYGNMECLISGYGKINKRERSQILLYAKVKLISKAECKRLHGRNMDKFICNSRDFELGDTERGDSGGPLVCRNTGDKNDQGQGVIVGVVSGARKLRRKWNSFQTRVSSYQNFVRNKVTKNLPLLNIIWISLIMSNFGCYSV